MKQKWKAYNFKEQATTAVVYIVMKYRSLAFSFPFQLWAY